VSERERVNGDGGSGAPAAFFPVTMRVDVECYAGYRAEETPRVLRFGDRRVRVIEVLDRWLAPDHRYFKLRGDDDAAYVVRYDTERDEWELAVASFETGT
jgi:hypothetical protein